MVETVREAQEEPTWQGRRPPLSPATPGQDVSRAHLGAALLARAQAVSLVSGRWRAAVCPLQARAQAVSLVSGRRRAAACSLQAGAQALSLVSGRWRAAACPLQARPQAWSGQRLIVLTGSRAPHPLQQRNFRILPLAWPPPQAVRSGIKSGSQ